MDGLALTYQWQQLALLVPSVSVKTPAQLSASVQGARGSCDAIPQALESQRAGKGLFPSADQS